MAGTGCRVEDGREAERRDCWSLLLGEVEVKMTGRCKQEESCRNLKRRAEKGTDRGRKRN